MRSEIKYFTNGSYEVFTIKNITEEDLEKLLTKFKKNTPGSKSYIRQYSGWSKDVMDNHSRSSKNWNEKNVNEYLISCESDSRSFQNKLDTFIKIAEEHYFQDEEVVEAERIINEFFNKQSNLKEDKV